MTAQETAHELVKDYLAIQENISWTEDKELVKDLEEWYKINTEAEMYWLILAQKSALFHTELMIEHLTNKSDTQHHLNDYKKVRDELCKMIFFTNE